MKCATVCTAEFNALAEANVQVGSVDRDKMQRLIYFVAVSDDKNANIGAVVEGGIALGFGISAITGWRRTRQCRALDG